MSANVTANLPPGYLDEYRGYVAVGTCVAFTVIEVVFVSLRFLSRWLGKIPMGVDDILIVPALIICIATNAVGIAMVQYAGVGHHLLALEAEDPSKLVLWAQFLVAEPIIYFASVVLPKIVILLIYLRVFTERNYRLACYVLGAIIILTAVVDIFVAGFNCIPISYLWDKTIPGGHCINTDAFFAWASFPNILTDTVMLALPLPVIWKLQTSKNVKIGLTVTFLTGSIGLITSIIRFVTFFTTDPVTDGTYTSVDLITWTVIEPGVYLIAACLPSLRPLLLQIWGSGVRSIYPNASKRSAGTSGNRRILVRQEYGFSRTGGETKNYAVNVKRRGLSPGEYHELNDHLESQRPFDGNYDDQAPINPHKSGNAIGVR